MKRSGKTTRWKRVTIRLVLGGLVLVCLGLIFNRQLTELVVKHNQRQLDHLPESTLVKNDRQKQWQKHPAKVKNFSGSDAVKSVGQSKQNRRATIAYLSIPKIRVHLPILYQVTNAHLAVGVATLRANMKLGFGNYVLFGHNFENATMLSNLDRLGNGDVITATNGRHTYKYRVFKNIVINEYNWHYTKPTKQKVMTVITCADGGATRQMVRGKLIAVS